MPSRRARMGQWATGSKCEKSVLGRAHGRRRLPAAPQPSVATRHGAARTLTQGALVVGSVMLLPWPASRAKTLLSQRSLAYSGLPQPRIGQTTTTTTTTPAGVNRNVISLHTLYTYTTRLPRRVPPVNPQVRPRHEGARFAEKEDCSAAVFLRLGQAAQHVLRWPCFPSLGVLLEELLDHGRHNVSW